MSKHKFQFHQWTCQVFLYVYYTNVKYIGVVWDIYILKIPQNVNKQNLVVQIGCWSEQSEIKVMLTMRNEDYETEVIHYDCTIFLQTKHFENQKLAVTR